MLAPMQPRWFRKLIARADEARLVEAIRAAERGNRGELRLHLERRYPGDGPIERAAQLFEALGLWRTRAGTGVLLYVAVEDHKAAVFAGPGIHAAAEPGFWKDVSREVAEGFRSNQPTAGLISAIGHIGELLRTHVPGDDDAGNELPDVVSAS